MAGRLDASVLNMEIFNQLLEMDSGDPRRSFTREIVSDFFAQARTISNQIRTAFPNDFQAVSQHAHFLKGSSGTVGLRIIETSCQRIQQYAKLLDPETDEPVSHDFAIQTLSAEIAAVQVLLTYCDAMLKQFYGEPLQKHEVSALSVPLNQQLATLRSNVAAGACHNRGTPYMLPVT